MVVYFYFLYVLERFFFFFKQKTAYEMRISDWSSDVCSSDLDDGVHVSRDSGFWIRDSGFGIRDWGLGIAEIRLRESLIPNPESPPCRNAGISARCRCR